VIADQRHMEWNRSGFCCCEHMVTIGICREKFREVAAEEYAPTGRANPKLTR
jgi:hypothetical protein